jgi:hypothetical protein
MLDLISRAWHRWDIRRRVREHGWTAIYVGDYESMPTWVYTIGFRRMLGAPEVVVFDVPQETANSLLWQIFAELRSGELVIRDGDRWGDPGQPQACWRRIHPSRFEDEEQPWLGLSLTLHKLSRSDAEPFEAFQLVLPDSEGRLPWEAGYDESLRPRQRELYLSDDEALARVAAPATM